MARTCGRWSIALVLVFATLATGAGTGHGAARAAGLGYAAPVNLAHLDFLHTTVPYTTSIPGHATTDLGTPLDTWWVYANYNKADGSYTPTGGGDYHPITNTYGQGAYDTDDVARAAVAYLTHYRYYGDDHSLQYARGALRFVLYMQTTSGPNAGNFVLWMQPDGTLNPMPTPADAPNPADAGASFWLARALWALGEGYATFKTVDPAFAAVLATRMELAMGALDSELVGPNYGQYDTLHGYQTPKWLIGDGADASSEALLGLAAYYKASGSAEAGKLATELGTGIAGYQFGSARDWPWQALLPWARSVSDWHAYAAHMADSLAVAGPLLGHADWVAAAERDANLFETHQQVAFGPVNGLLPALDDATQLAYGAETTTDGLLAVSHASGKRVYRQLAGLAAAWFFGNNAAGVAMYQPDSGVVYDGINGDGTINRNSGAESTIEGLLALMNAVNDPIASAYLGYSHVDRQDAAIKVEAESGALAGGATVVTPASAWTGEALWTGAWALPCLYRVRQATGPGGDGRRQRRGGWRRGRDRRRGGRRRAGRVTQPRPPVDRQCVRAANPRGWRPHGHLDWPGRDARQDRRGPAAAGRRGQGARRRRRRRAGPVQELRRHNVAPRLARCRGCGPMVRDRLPLRRAPAPGVPGVRELPPYRLCPAVWIYDRDGS